MIKLIKKHEIYNVYWENDLFLGTFQKDVDGFYYFWEHGNGGCWGENELRNIADSLQEINKEWNEYINNNLK